MRTTMNLPDELYRAVRVRAAEQGRTVTSLLEEALLDLLAKHEETPRESFRLGTLSRPGTAGIGIDVGDNAAIRDLLDDENS